ncbi:aldo/keto reductase [Halocatena halophila]|uniref:aldo/keto reductase n=1 Tax=Halocatena halophila TaxID=2814576 RepID=UPI002ED4CEFD
MARKRETWAYRDDHDEFARTYFRRFGESIVSSVGIGTYLGAPTDEVDDAYRETITTAIDGGCNVIDTAINYRHQRSERAVNAALNDSTTDRESVLVATKGGFVPFDRTQPEEPHEFIEREYFDSGLIDPDELVHGNCIQPAFIDDQLDRSLENLGLETIDCYYVHNPETQLTTKSTDAVYDQLEATFTRLERRAQNGDIRHYGIASWECFRVPPSHASYLSLPVVVDRARRAARAADSTATHFRAIQLPFNVQMADAFTVAAHESSEGTKSALRFAHDAGLSVFTSASLQQGALTNESAIPDAVDAKLSGNTAAKRAINFARSAPGVTSALIGTKSIAHAKAAIDAGRFEPMGATAFDETFE